MKLSEAIRLGSLLVKEPEMGWVGSCAIGMANLATNGHKVDIRGRSDVMEAYRQFEKTFPWLQSVTLFCPQCKWELRLSGNEIVWHLFDQHVMHDRMTNSSNAITIEQLADFIATIEPEEPETTKENANEIIRSDATRLYTRATH